MGLSEKKLQLIDKKPVNLIKIHQINTFWYSLLHIKLKLTPMSSLTLVLTSISNSTFSIDLMDFSHSIILSDNSIKKSRISKTHRINSIEAHAAI